MENSYDSRRCSFREKVLSGDSSCEIHENFLTLVGQTPEGSKILDIGTGNGYILREIERNYPKNYKLFGVDISPEMLKEAERLSEIQATLILADNNHLPFDENYFSTVTAKNVTNFSSDELARILEGRGLFVYREYGKGKGLTEIAKCFKDRLIRSRNPNFYADQLDQSGFEDIQIQTYTIPKKYTFEEVLEIVQMFPFINNLSESDFEIIKDLFGGKKKITLTSDPFILTARRKKK